MIISFPDLVSLLDVVYTSCWFTIAFVSLVVSSLEAECAQSSILRGAYQCLPILLVDLTRISPSLRSPCPASLAEAFVLSHVLVAPWLQRCEAQSFEQSSICVGCQRCRLSRLLEAQILQYQLAS